MRSLRVAIAALVGAWLTCAAAPSFADGCHLQEIAELPLTMDGGAPLVEMTIDGHPTRFVLDTGAATTVITEAGAASLGLKPVLVEGVTFYGAGGSAPAGRAHIQELKLGGAVVHNLDWFVTGRAGAGQFAGLLGRDVLLANNDLELDLANHVARMLKPKDCHGDEVAYWAKSYSLATIHVQSSGVAVNVSLNGKPTFAILDTGATGSVVTLGAAHIAGVTPKSLGVTEAGQSSGMGGMVQTWVGTFQTLSVGTETIQNAELALADLFSKDKQVFTGSHIASDPWDEPEMLLGADFLKAHRVYIAASQGKLYFTYNGGRIFEPPPGAVIDSHPTTTDGHLDRGWALLNAGRYAEALKEFDTVIALDPQSKPAWSGRALAHAWLLDPTALTDADKSVSLGAPRTVSADVRGQFAVNTGDVAGARAAYRQLLALSPNDVHTLLQLFRLDLRVGDTDAAAQDLALLKQTPQSGSVEVQVDFIALQHRLERDADAQRALDDLESMRNSPVDRNDVCYELAVAGIFLDRALADCKASLRVNPGAAATLDSLGFVLLRLGRNAEALQAYDAALAAKPDEYNSMYGRGLAEARLGRADDATRDIHAALAASPYLRQSFEDMGVK